MQAMPAINPRIVSLIVIRVSFQGQFSSRSKPARRFWETSPDSDLEFLVSLNLGLVIVGIKQSSRPRIASNGRMSEPNIVSNFGRFDTLGDSDHLNSDELVSWTGMRHTASRNACRPGAITKERNRVASRRGGMFWPEHLPVDPERFLKEWLGFGVLAHRFEKEPKVIQGSGGLGLLRTPSALCHFKRPLRNRNRLLIFSLFNQFVYLLIQRFWIIVFGQCCRAYENPEAKC